MVRQKYNGIMNTHQHQPLLSNRSTYTLTVNSVEGILYLFLCFSMDRFITTTWYLNLRNGLLATFIVKLSPASAIIITIPTGTPDGYHRLRII